MVRVGYPLDYPECSTSNLPLIKETIGQLAEDVAARWGAVREGEVPPYSLRADAEFDDLDPDDAGEVYVTMTCPTKGDMDAVQPFVWASIQYGLEARGVLRVRPYISVSTEAEIVHMPCKTWHADEFFEKVVGYRGHGMKVSRCECGQSHNIRIYDPKRQEMDYELYDF